MTGKDEQDVVTRLQKLADQLEKAYPEAGERVSKAVREADALIGRIGVTLEPKHRDQDELERNLDPSEPRPHAFRIGGEGQPEGLEYGLCAARGRDGRCGLYVSTCETQKWEEQMDIETSAGGHATRSKSRMRTKVGLLKPDELPLPLRVQILDVLPKFLEAYEEHVRKDRAKLLDGSVVPKPKG